MNTLPLLHLQHYEAFKQALALIDQLITPLAVDTSAVQSEVTALQQFFRDRLLPLPLDEMPLERQQWLQSYQVEIDKQLRLLGMDIMFLQAARQAATTEQRQQQIRDRLDTLRRYCNAVLEQSVNS